MKRFALASLTLPTLLLPACSDSPSGPPAPAADIRFISLPMPVDLSPDGRIALLQDYGNNLFFYHPATGELELKTRVGSEPVDFATAISDNGVVTGVHGYPAQAG